jgi:ubiquinone/menaquinone biosynthesis C-methylase UbiE
VDREEAVVNFYDLWILPPILDLVMRQHQLQRYRREVVTAASGRVLEVGVGSGLNFPLYSKQVDIVFGIDPSPRLLAIARQRAATASIRAELLQGSATAIPLADNTIDTVVMTWTLCSIPDPLTALREIRRVLKPHGKLLFVEHGLSSEPRIERWQHRLTPVWGHIAGGCHLDRKMDDLIRTAGFDILRLRTEYAAGPRPMTYMYVGCAQSAA